MKLARENVVVFAPGLRRPVVLPKMRYFRHPHFRGLFAAPDAPRVGLAEKGRPLPLTPAPAAPPPGGLTLDLTAEQVRVAMQRAKPGETPEAYIARFLATARKGPKAPPPSP